MTIEAPTAPPPAGPLKAPPATARVRQRPGDGGPPPSLEVPEDAMQPPRIVLNAIEGFGKTSAIANAPRAAIIMDPMETGYLTLMGVGLAPRIPAAVVEQWPHLVQMVNDFAAAETVPFRVLGIDALTGFVSLLTAYICEREFGGNMTRKEGGFGNFGQGVDLCVEEWKRLEVALEKLRRRHRVAILMTSHYGSKTHGRWRCAGGMPCSSAPSRARWMGKRAAAGPSA